MGEVSWGYYSGLIRVVAWPVYIYTWLLSVLFGSCLENDMNSLVVSQGLVYHFQKLRNHLLWDSFWLEPEDIGRQQENILLSTGSLAKWSISGSGMWLPGPQEAMVFFLFIIKEVESPLMVPLLEPLPQKRPPKTTPVIDWYSPTSSYLHLDTYQHKLSYHIVAWQA
jgi:hypothetical protein